MDKRKYYMPDVFAKREEIEKQIAEHNLAMAAIDKDNDLEESRKQSDEIKQIEKSLHEHISGPDYENIWKLGCWVIGGILAVGIVIILSVSP